MLWIEKYRPETFDSLLGQASAAKQLTAYADAGNLPHVWRLRRHHCAFYGCYGNDSHVFPGP